MGSIWVKEFTGGLDTRRMPETTSGAVLMRASNGHITRGGEFEKREAFVLRYSLPPGTVGLAATPQSLVVFGGPAEPTGMPAAVDYKRLQHPSAPSRQIDTIRSWDLYASKLYTAAQYTDEDVYLHYDGALVTAWADGLSRGWFRIKQNAVTPGVRSRGQFRVHGGSSDATNTLDSIKVGGQELIAAPVAHTGGNGGTAAAIVAAINAYTSTSGFKARQKAWIVQVLGPANETYNGNEIEFSKTGTFALDRVEDMAGGVDPVPPTTTSVTVGSRELLTATITWSSDAAQAAIDVAANIAANSAISRYTATAEGNKVIVQALDQGPAPNGLEFAMLGTNDAEISTQSAMAGGSTTGLAKGTFLQTISKKVYAVAGSVFYFSGIAAPTRWTSDYVGAGFIDFASEISGAEELQAVAKYQNYAAIFARTTTVIEYLDPDPALNRQVQVLEGTGTSSPKSVTQFGDTDVYYLDSSGLRSLRSRDSSNAAATADIGVAIDSLIIAKMKTLTEREIRDIVIGIIEPQDKRFWLIMKDVIYVFSYFQGAKVSAWTTYTPSYFDEADEEHEFTISDAVVFNEVLYLRSGNRIFSYGGSISETIYDATIAEGWLPYLDANAPTRKKEWNGADIAVTGEWEVAIAMDPQNEEAEEIIARVDKSTFDHDALPVNAESTHASLRFRTTGDGPARVSACVLTYKGDDIEDR